MQHLQPNTTLQGGKYKIERVLGQGGFGITYLAKYTSNGRKVAIKELFINGVNDRNNSEVTVSNRMNDDFFDRQKEKFQKEAKRIKSLKNEHIVRVYDVFEGNGTVYYVMDLIKGESLADKMKREGRPLTEDEALHIFPQILDALLEIHKYKIWHLDIKPGNIMLDTKQNIVLIDFGASKQITPSESTSTAPCFTPGYAPMEQTGGLVKQIGPWTDLYALGATLYNLLTRQSPSDFDIDEFKEDDLPENNLQLMYTLINWMMQPKRKDRPQTTLDVKQRFYVELVKIGLLSILNDVLGQTVKKTIGTDIDIVKELHATSAQCKQIVSDIKETFDVEVDEETPLTFDFLCVEILSSLGLIFHNDEEKENTESVTDDDVRQWEELAEEQRKILKEQDDVTIVNTPHQKGLSAEEKINELRKRAEAGDTEAQVDLGIHYMEKNDPYMAIVYFRKAAEAGDPIGQYNLAVCYQNGTGVTQNYDAALRWYSKAAEQGDEDAIKNKQNLQQYIQSQTTQPTKDVDFWDDCVWPASYLTLGLLFVYVILALFMDWPTPNSSDGYFTEHNMPFIIIFGVIWVGLSCLIYAKEKDS